MAKKFLSAIQLLTVNADPASASAGDLYFNTTSNLVKYHDGTSWVAVPKNLSNLNDVIFDSLQNGDILSFNASNNEWQNIRPSQNQTIEFGTIYPTTNLQDGQLFYNIVNNRLAIYYENVWRELAYYPDTEDLDGGASNTETFGLIVDGGNSFTTLWINIYDGGNSTGFPEDQTFDGGESNTLTFSPIFEGGNSTTLTFSPTLDGGNSL